MPNISGCRSLQAILEICLTFIDRDANPVPTSPLAIGASINLIIMHN